MMLAKNKVHPLVAKEATKDKERKNGRDYKQPNRYP